MVSKNSIISLVILISIAVYNQHVKDVIAANDGRLAVNRLTRNEVREKFRCALRRRKFPVNNQSDENDPTITSTNSNNPLTTTIMPTTTTVAPYTFTQSCNKAATLPEPTGQYFQSNIKYYNLNN